MASLTAEEKQEVLQGYARVRAFEILIFLAAVAGGTLFILTLKNPSLAIAGLTGLPLVIAGGVVLLSAAVLHFLNWRCPGCRRGLQRGVGGMIRCSQCGVVFNAKQMAKPGLTVNEGALKKEMKLYDAVTVKRLVQGIIVFGAGLAFFLFAAPKDTVPVPFGAPAGSTECESLAS